MGEPPAELGAELDLDGFSVRWPRGSPWLRSLLLGGAALALSVLVISLPNLWPVVVLVGLLVLVGAMLTRPLPAELIVDERWITLRVQGQDDLRFPLERLEKIGVVPPESILDSHRLYLRSGDVKIKFGGGLQVQSLQWIYDGIEEARVVAARRVATEGKEYGFEKVAPPEVVELTER